VARARQRGVVAGLAGAEWQGARPAAGEGVAAEQGDHEQQDQSACASANGHTSATEARSSATTQIFDLAGIQLGILSESHGGTISTRCDPPAVLADAGDMLRGGTTATIAIS
jgi:hypothetical protein